MTSFRKASPRKHLLQRKYFDTRFPNSCISALFITQTIWCWVLTETNCSTFQYNTTNQLQTCNRHYYYDNYPRKYQLFSNAALITSFNFKSLSCPVYTLPYEGRQSNMLLTRLVGKLTILHATDKYILIYFDLIYSIYIHHVGLRYMSVFYTWPVVQVDVPISIDWSPKNHSNGTSILIINKVQIVPRC